MARAIGAARLGLVCACGLLTACTASAFDELAIMAEHHPAPVARTFSTIHIGLLNFESETSYSQTRDNVQSAIVEYLRRRFPELTIEAHYYTTPELVAAIAQSRVDLFLASSGFYVAMLPHGVRDIGTLVSANFPDPNRVVSGTMFVRSDRAGPATLESIRGLTAISTHHLNFMTYQINMAEIALHNFDPDTFFRSVRFTNNNPKAVLEAVLNGQAEVGLLRQCMLEAFTQANPEYAGKFTVINAQPASLSPCQVSTRPYPGWTMAVTPHTPAQIARDFANALLEMQPEDSPSGYTWSLATDFKGANDVLRIMRVGPYSHLNDWTLGNIIALVWPYLGFFAGLLLAGVLHLVSVKRLVALRTLQLNDTMQSERIANARAQEVTARLNLMQRISTISQLSSIFAHELGQPLSAMTYSLRGLQTLSAKLPAGAQTPTQAKNMASCIDILQKQLVRCSEIIDRVRSYAKQSGDRESVINLCELIAETISDIRQTRSAPDFLKLTLPAYPVMVVGNAVELKLLVLNLIKNASEEIAQSEGNALLAVTLSQDSTGRQAVLTVENSGRFISEAELARLQEPFASSKAKGLGLGLLIVTSIAEAHKARIRFEPRAEGGLLVTFAIAIWEDTERAPIEKATDTEFGDKF